MDVIKNWSWHNYCFSQWPMNLRSNPYMLFLSFFVLPTSFGLASGLPKDLRQCPLLFSSDPSVQHPGNKITAEGNGTGYRSKTANLTDAFVETARIHHLQNKKTKPTIARRLGHFLRSLFLKSERNDGLEKKFGSDWQKHLEDGSIILDYTDLDDSQLNLLVTYLQENKKDFEGVGLELSLVANQKLTTTGVLNFVESGLLIHELDLQFTNVDTAQIVSSIVIHQKKIRKLAIDNVGDADLVALAELRELRELDIDNSRVFNSMSLRWRWGIYRAFEKWLDELSPVSNVTRSRAGYTNYQNFCTIDGLKRFISSQSRPVVSVRGNTSAYNPHLKKLVLPRIASDNTWDDLQIEFDDFIEQTDQSPLVNPNGLRMIDTGNRYGVRFVRAKDGDTFRFVSRSFGDRRFDLRLTGVDTFEKDAESPLERKISRAALNFSSHYLKIAQRIDVLSDGITHQGRLIGHVVIYDSRGQLMHLNQALIINGLAIPYDGSTNRERNQRSLEVSAENLYQSFRANIDFWASQAP